MAQIYPDFPASVSQADSEVQHGVIHAEPESGATSLTALMFEVTELGPGDYKVKQVGCYKPKTVAATSAQRKNFSFSVKVFSVHGYVDIGDKEIAAWPSVLGYQIGDGWKAGFDSGLQIQLVLAVYNGSIRFWVEGNDLKYHLHLKPLIPIYPAVNSSGTAISF